MSNHWSVWKLQPGGEFWAKLRGYGVPRKIEQGGGEKFMAETITVVMASGLVPKLMTIVLVDLQLFHSPGWLKVRV